MSADILTQPGARERVIVAPPEDWVVVREDEEMAAASAVPGTNPALLIDRQRHVARRESYDRLVRRLDTMQAVHDAAQWRLSFDPNVHHLTIHALSVRREGVRHDYARREAVRLLQREESMEHLVIDGWMTAVVLLEDVRVGDIVDTSFSLHTIPRLLPENYWFLATLPAGVALRHYRLEIRFPSGQAMRWKSNADPLGPVVTEADGDTVWTWTVENPPLQEPEPGVPSWHLTHWWVQVSDLASWGEVAAGVTAAWVEQFDDPELLRMAEEIAAAAATPEARGSRALTFIQDEIRYLSVETGVGGQIPSPPGVVLRRRFGDCKDKSFLAAHLLRRLGIPARPVLVSTVLRQTVADLLPMPDVFNHAVVEFEIGGQRRWVDTTLPQQGGGALSRPAPDFRIGLPVGPGVADLENLPSLPETRDFYHLHETFFLDTSGRSSTLRVRLTVRGRDAETLRRRFVHEGVEAVARHREQLYRQIFPELARAGELEWIDDREQNELILGEKFYSKRMLITGTKPGVAIFHYPAYLIRSLLSSPETTQRRQPFALPHPCDVEHHIEIESTTIQGGRSTNQRNHGAPFQLACHVAPMPGRLSVRLSLRTLLDSVPPEKFANFRAKVEEIAGWTVLNYALPLGVAAAGGNRKSEALLPRRRTASVPPENTTPSFADPAAPVPRLPAIAPPLASCAKPEPKPHEAAVPKPARRAATPAPPDLTTDEPVPTPRMEPRRSRRRRKRQDRRDLWISGSILLGVAVVIFAIYYFFR